MTTRTIYKKIRDLRKEYQLKSTPDALRERVILTWEQWVLDHLETIYANHQADVVALAEGIKLFLEQNWTLTHGTLTSFTSIPHSEVTGLLIDIVKLMTKQSNDSSVYDIQWLMPTINIESVRDDYPDLNAETDVPTILQTHITGIQGRYLLPVQLLNDAKLLPEPTALNNPYYDYQNFPEGTGILNDLNSEEGRRLIEHSPLTRAVYETKQAYDALANDKSNLLGQLTILCQHLKFNSAYGGIGEDRNAGEGVYLPIYQFMGYYNLLDESKKALIPVPLKKAISRLLDVIGDSSINPDADKTIDACIGTRRTDIIDSMKNHGKLLSEIALSDAQKHNLVENARKQFEEARKELADAFATNQYSQGHDNQGMTKKLLNELKIKLRISSIDDLSFIKSASPTEIVDLFDNKKLITQAIKVLANVENLVIFFLETSAERITAFLDVAGDEIIKQWGGSGEDFGPMLTILEQEEKFRAVFSWIKPNIIEALDLAQILCCLSSKQQDLVFEIMGENLFVLMNTANDINYILEFASEPHRDLIVQHVKEHLFEFIKTPDNYSLIVEFLPRKHRENLYKLVKDWLPDNIKTARDFTVFSFLSKKEGGRILTKIKNRLHEIIKDWVDYFEVNVDMQESHRDLVFNLMKDHFRTIIKTGYQFYRIKAILPEKIDLFNMMKDKFPEMIKTSHDFMTVQLMSQRQFIDFLRIMDDHMPAIIKTCDDFGTATQYMNAREYALFCDRLHDHFRTIFKTTQALKRVMELGEDEYITILYESIKDQLPYIAQTGKQWRALDSARDFLTEDQQDTVDSIIDLMDDLRSANITTIKAIQDFASALMNGYSEKINQQFESLIKTELPVDKLAEVLVKHQYWLEKINKKVGLKLKDSQMSSAWRIQLAIEQHFAPGEASGNAKRHKTSHSFFAASTQNEASSSYLDIPAKAHRRQL